jgi:mannose-1-phosphate guanylyltransferase
MPVAGSDVYAVVMAGGLGSRFWPRSRRARPKQFLAIASRRSMLEDTCRRLRPLVSPKNLLIVAAREHAPHVRRLLPDLPRGNLLLEPFGRGTAPCIGLAALHVERRCPGALLVAVPADHVVEGEAGLRRVIRSALSLAREEDSVVTVGITPTRAEPGYGYIRRGRRVGGRGGERAWWVQGFFEKPSRRRAARLVRDGAYLWNSGMFVFRAATALRAMREFLPAVHAELTRAVGAGRERARALRSAYERLPSVSFDRGVMERLCRRGGGVGGRSGRRFRAAVVEGDFGWSDVGSWDAIAALGRADGRRNLAAGRAVFVDTRGATVMSSSRLVALVGLEDVIVVDTEDALLVCRRDRGEDVRRVVDELTARGWHAYT